MGDDFSIRLEHLVRCYLEQDAPAREHLALLRWQLQQAHRLDRRTTMPGHLTTSAIVLSPDNQQVLLIDHIAIGRWLQPGGHYEPADQFWKSAAREAVEETAVVDILLHPWHQCEDRPFVIDSHDVPGKAALNEPPHVHHDLQYLFVTDPQTPLVHQAAEVHGVRWAPLGELADIAPKAATRLSTLF